MTSRLVISVPGEPKSQDRRTRQCIARDGRRFAGTYLLPETRRWRERRDHFGDIAKMVGLNRFVSDQERADAEKHTP